MKVVPAHITSSYININNTAIIMPVSKTAIIFNGFIYSYLAHSKIDTHEINTARNNTRRLM